MQVNVQNANLRAEMWEGMKVSAKYARNSALGPSKTATEEEVRERVWLSNHPQ